MRGETLCSKCYQTAHRQRAKGLKASLPDYVAEPCKKNKEDCEIHADASGTPVQTDAPAAPYPQAPANKPPRPTRLSTENELASSPNQEKRHLPNDHDESSDHQRQRLPRARKVDHVHPAHGEQLLSPAQPRKSKRCSVASAPLRLRQEVDDSEL